MKTVIAVDAMGGDHGPSVTVPASLDFLAAHPVFVVEPPAECPVAPDAAGFVRCLPHRHGTDGFTAIRFRRG